MLLQKDPELLRRFRAGEPRALTTAYNHYTEVLARFLVGGFGFTSNGQSMYFDGVRERYDLHDIMAETFRRAFERRARLAYSGLSPYSAFLKTIARNLTIDYLRSSSRMVAREIEDSELDQAPTSTPERRFEHAELGHLMGSFIGDLPQIEQRFIELRYHEEMTQMAVASRMKKSRRWVRTLEKDLRKRLLVHMENTGYVPRIAASTR